VLVVRRDRLSPVVALVRRLVGRARRPATRGVCDPVGVGRRGHVPVGAGLAADAQVGGVDGVAVDVDHVVQLGVVGPEAEAVTHRSVGDVWRLGGVLVVPGARETPVGTGRLDGGPVGVAGHVETDLVGEVAGVDLAERGGAGGTARDVELGESGLQGGGRERALDRPTGTRRTRAVSPRTV
jgi:hypothetical protein